MDDHPFLHTLSLHSTYFTSLLAVPYKLGKKIKWVSRERVLLFSIIIKHDFFSFIYFINPMFVYNMDISVFHRNGRKWVIKKMGENGFHLICFPCLFTLRIFLLITSIFFVFTGMKVIFYFHRRKWCFFSLSLANIFLFSFPLLGM